MEDSDLPANYNEANYSTDEEEVTISRVEESRTWPGVKHNIKTVHILRKLAGGKEDRWVELKMGRNHMRLYADTGSKYTIITPDLYKSNMGEVVAADTRLRAWGSRKPLDVKGMFHTRLTTAKGATKKTCVYVVDGYRPETLLGDSNAEDLGIISFNKEGREKTEEEKILGTTEQVNLLVPDLRKAGIQVQTHKAHTQGAGKSEHEQTRLVVEKFQGSVFSDRIGKVKTTPIKLEYETGFKPVQPPRFTVPYHYQERLSQHL